MYERLSDPWAWRPAEQGAEGFHFREEQRRAQQGLNLKIRQAKDSYINKKKYIERGAAVAEQHTRDVKRLGQSGTRGTAEADQRRSMCWTCFSADLIPTPLPPVQRTLPPSLTIFTSTFLPILLPFIFDPSRPPHTHWSWPLVVSQGTATFLSSAFSNISAEAMIEHK